MVKYKTRRTAINTTNTSSYVFTNAEKMKQKFFAHTTVRQAEKISNDASYWTGGRCEWGGSHNLAEDTETLANFFNGIASITDDINEIRLSANETIFNQRKQALISKIQQLLSKCQVTSATSVGGICIIWNDFFGSFLKKFLDNFSAKLQKNLTSIEQLEPKHQKELLDLESQARATENAYKENLQKANDETDPVKKAEFIVLANNATKNAEKIKQKIKTNPLIQASNFSYLDDLKKLAKGNVPPNVSPNKKASNSGSSSNNKGNNDFLTKYRKEIFIGVVGLGLMFYIYNQDEQELERPRAE